MKMYRTMHHPEGLSTFPEYELRGQFLFTTHNAGTGPSFIPFFQIKKNRVYPTPHHPEGRSSFHWFEIRNGEVLIPSLHHPEGGDCRPWYKIK
jgi:hypothetical protein